MTTPSKTISMADIRKELGITSGSTSLGDARVRTLAGVPSGTISMSQLRNKSANWQGRMKIGGSVKIYTEHWLVGWSGNGKFKDQPSLFDGFGTMNGQANKHIQIPANGVFSGSKACWLAGISSTIVATSLSAITFFSRSPDIKEIANQGVLPMNIGTNTLKLTIVGLGTYIYKWKVVPNATYSDYQYEGDGAALFKLLKSKIGNTYTVKIEKG